MKKKQVWAVVDWGTIIKAGFASAAAAYDWMVTHGVDGTVARVWA